MSENKITFITKANPNSVCQKTQVFMVKDGKEYFVMTISKNSQQDEKSFECYKEQLIANDGEYYCAFGSETNIFRFLKKVCKTKHHWRNGFGTAFQRNKNANCWDFVEVFSSKEKEEGVVYRIYDNELAKYIAEILVVIYDREYEEALTLIEKHLPDEDNPCQYVYVCFEENYNDLLIENHTLNALCVKDTFDKAYQFLSKQIESGINEGFVEDEATVNEPKENIEKDLTEHGRFSTIMFRGRQENDNESYAIVIERKVVE